MCQNMDKNIKEIINEDKGYYFGKGVKRWYRFFVRNPIYRRGQYIIICRKVGYYKFKRGLWNKFLMMIYQRKKNILGEKLHIELGPDNFGRRLRIYHNDIVINGGVVIGDDCELYGNNCIGNKGSHSAPLAAPTIGNHVSFGVGAKAIGNIQICNYAQISSMSLINKNILEAGLYGGIPAKLLKTSK